MTPDIIRVTRSSPGRWAGSEYPTRNPFNCTSTMFLVLDVDHFALYGIDGRLIQDLPFMAASSAPCWSSDDPSVLYFGAGTTILKSFNVATSSTQIIKNFEEEFSVGCGEGDISAVGGYLPIVLSGRLSLYHAETGIQMAGLQVSFKPESVYIIRSGHVLVSCSAEGSGPSKGMHLYSNELNYLRQIATVDPHKDTTLDADRAPVVVWCNSNVMPEPPKWKNAAVKTNLLTGEETGLISFPWDVAFHVSCPDRLPLGVKPFCFISTSIANSDKGQILQVFLDGVTPPVVLCDTGYLWREQDKLNYAGASLATVSPNGGWVLFRSNKDNTSAWANYCDAYLLRLGPANSAAAAPDTSPQLSLQERVTKLEAAMLDLQARVR